MCPSGAIGEIAASLVESEAVEDTYKYISMGRLRKVEIRRNSLPKIKDARLEMSDAVAYGRAFGKHVRSMRLCRVSEMKLSIK